MMGGTRSSHLGAGNVLELDLDGGHTAVYSIKNSSSRLGSVCLHGLYLNKVLFKKHRRPHTGAQCMRIHLTMQRTRV